MLRSCWVIVASHTCGRNTELDFEYSIVIMNNNRNTYIVTEPLLVMPVKHDNSKYKYEKKYKYNITHWSECWWLEAMFGDVSQGTLATPNVSCHRQHCMMRRTMRWAVNHWASSFIGWHVGWWLNLNYYDYHILDFFFQILRLAMGAREWCCVEAKRCDGAFTARPIFACLPAVRHVEYIIIFTLGKVSN